jgi:hypothetical protein
LLGSRPRVTMEAQLEAVFSMWSAPRLYHASDSSILVQFRMRYSCELPVTVELSVLSAVASKQATRKGAPVQPVEKNNRASDCDDCNCNCKGVSQ